MPGDELPRTEPRDVAQRQDEAKRNEALTRYDSHPGIALLLLAVMAFLFIVATYQFLSDRLEDRVVSGREKNVRIEAPNPPTR